MVILVTGGSGSGKSQYAEELITAAGNGLRYYVATMEAFGEEGQKKVERHRELRQGKGFHREKNQCLLSASPIWQPMSCLGLRAFGQKIWNHCQSRSSVRYRPFCLRQSLASL